MKKITYIYFHTILDILTFFLCSKQWNISVFNMQMAEIFLKPHILQGFPKASEE